MQPQQHSKEVEDELLRYMISIRKKRRRIERAEDKKLKIRKSRIWNRFLVQFNEKKARVQQRLLQQNGSNTSTFLQQQQDHFDVEYGYRSDESLGIDENMLKELRTGPDELNEKGERVLTHAKSKKIWSSIGRKHIPKVHKIYQQSILVKNSNSRKIAQLCQREVRRAAARSAPQFKDITVKSRRAMREMLVFWKRNEREERELRKRAEKEEMERRKVEEEMRESKRQARKLNFLISQTELYGHFIGKKMEKPADDVIGKADVGDSNIAAAAAVVSNEESGQQQQQEGEEIDFDAATDEQIALHAARSAQRALDAQKQKTMAFDKDMKVKRAEADEEDEEMEDGGRNVNMEDAVDQMDFVNPSLPAGSIEVPQPQMLTCQLKSYQLKGMNWLANLYEQGINGILADEMGLGKTVQSISLMAYLAETHNIWGPFLVITPASTLHNWQQEISKFAPHLKSLPYWGNMKDRKVLRSFWNSKKLYSQDAPFHVLITSYQLVVSDEQYFRRINWQYMILDEAQAIKSSGSARWKTLLSFNCRNRLLLTGTPIQNSMQELWALLHFIMPTLFDSHEEFSDWFSKDIESHTQHNGTLNEHQLRRLHMILKPFMLRRIKKDVENELADKIEKEVLCHLTARQKKMYQGLKEKITIAELLDKVTSLTGSVADGDEDSAAVASLMNLVMQFRKVCNHPELFERADVISPMWLFPSSYFPPRLERVDAMTIPFAAAGAIEYSIPRSLYKSGLIIDHYVPCVTSRCRWSRSLSLFCIFHPENVYKSVYDIRSRADDQSALLSRTFSFLRFTDYGVSEASALFTAGLVWRSVAEALKRWLNHGTSEYNPDFNDLFVRNYTLLFETKRPVKHLWTLMETDYVHDYLVRMPKVFVKPVISGPAVFHCSDRRFSMVQSDTFFSLLLRPIFRGKPLDLSTIKLTPSLSRINLGRKSMSAPSFLIDKCSAPDILVPGSEKLVGDCGKLQVLEKMLPKLKSEGHRVLIYFQMTKMIDLMEEYLNYRKYSYLRLDGSTSISERRDMVSDWQSRPELFIFLLSTRAGGLGINLTAADTVIFYDSDWNPTVDQQAMDRAHRLGQTKQVTVYRLITAGSIEERILIRAKQKDQIQKVVISEGGFKQQVEFKSKEVLSLLLDDDDLVEEALQKQAAKQKQDEAAAAAKSGRGRGRGRGRGSRGPRGGGRAGNKRGSGPPSVASGTTSSKPASKRGRKTKDVE